MQQLSHDLVQILTLYYHAPRDLPNGGCLKDECCTLTEHGIPAQDAGIYVSLTMLGGMFHQTSGRQDFDAWDNDVRKVTLLTSNGEDRCIIVPPHTCEQSSFLHECVRLLSWHILHDPHTSSLIDFVPAPVQSALTFSRRVTSNAALHCQASW